jgi:hypothetical protein
MATPHIVIDTVAALPILNRTLCQKLFIRSLLPFSR